MRYFVSCWFCTIEGVTRASGSCCCMPVASTAVDVALSARGIVSFIVRQDGNNIVNGRTRLDQGKIWLFYGIEYRRQRVEEETEPASWGRVTGSSRILTGFGPESETVGADRGTTK